MTRLFQSVLVGAVALLGALPGIAQRATPVQSLDLNQIAGTWYQIARLPDKPEKKCISDGMILYALNDKPHSFQMGLFCKIKGGDAQNINSAGKQNKKQPGELKVSRFLILSTKYEVLATDPASAWLVVGSRNHKALWLLSRTPALGAGTTRADLERTAAAQGFKTEKLLTVRHTVTGFRAEETAPTGATPAGATQVQPVVQTPPRLQQTPPTP